jgi:hypothetical protein
MRLLVVLLILKQCDACCHAGWVQLYQTSFCIPTAEVAQQQQQQPCASLPAHQHQQHAAEQDIALRDAERYDKYYAAYYGLPPPTPDQLQQQQQQQQIDQQRQRQQRQQRQGPVPAWQAAISAGACFELPMTVQQAADAALAAPASAGEALCGLI